MKVDSQRWSIFLVNRDWKIVWPPLVYGLWVNCSYRLNKLCTGPRPRQRQPWCARVDRPLVVSISIMIVVYAAYRAGRPRQSNDNVFGPSAAWTHTRFDFISNDDESSLLFRCRVPRAAATTGGEPRRRRLVVGSPVRLRPAVLPAGPRIGPTAAGRLCAGPPRLWPGMAATAEQVACRPFQCRRQARRRHDGRERVRRGPQVPHQRAQDGRLERFPRRRRSLAVAVGLPIHLRASRGVLQNVPDRVYVGLPPIAARGL